MKNNLYKKPELIAEVGCNHMGDLNIAKNFIKTGKEFCNLEVIKFQKRDPKSLLSEEQYNQPHPIEENSFGKTYGEHREFLEFDIEQHKILQNHCSKLGLEYFSSVWDIQSTIDICSLNTSKIKIGSASNTNKEILEYLCKNYYGDVHLSLGMTTRIEEEEIIDLFVRYNKNKNLIIYACTSTYPTAAEDICLLEISRLLDEYKEKNIVKDIGFSGHHKGIAIDVAAYLLGANYIERHFTLDRTWKGTDHSASLEPDGMRKLKRNLDQVYSALNYKDKEVLDSEIVFREKLKYKHQT